MFIFLTKSSLGHPARTLMTHHLHVIISVTVIYGLFLMYQTLLYSEGKYYFTNEKIDLTI